MARDGKGFVEGHDESIGKGEHANMPQEVQMKPYPKSAGMRGDELDDTMSDIDRYQEEADRTRRSKMSHQK